MQYSHGLATVSLLVGVWGCGGSDGGPPSGPYDDVELTQDLEHEGLEGPVHAVRDQFGIVHIHADNVADMAFAQGYVMAHDRLPQMDILRRFGAGTLSELFGALEEDVVETDLEMRVHDMTGIATRALEQLRASADPVDVEIVSVLDRFAAGVNAYRDDLVAGKFEIDRAVGFSWDPERFREWTPVDSLVLGRFQAFALSWTTPIEVDITDIYQSAQEHFDDSPASGQPGFDAARDARRGIAADLLRTTPIDKTATIDGFPNVDTDSGTRSDGPQKSSAAKRPRVPRHLLSKARRFFRKKMKMGPHSFMVPRAGSNNWAVGPTLAGGKALLAGDQHLSLPNPSIFYPTHLVVPDKLDVEGITFPGIPGVILGHNGNVAWSATVVFHDVNDIYLENITPCSGGSGDCVTFEGNEVQVEKWTEQIEIGALGTITETKTVTYERVPHHGPIIPDVVDRELIPRSTSEALSVRYTGHEITHEIRATYKLAQAKNIDEAFAALGDFEYGGQNWVMIDSTGKIAWTSNANVPLRAPAAYTWHPTNNPKGNAPFLVLPSDGSAEWEGFMDTRYVPHAIDPAQGYIATANSDPVGATFDGDPLNGPMVDGRPLYLSAVYAPGLRTAQIAKLIDQKAAAGTVTLDDLADIQHNSTSTMGTHLKPALVAALNKVDSTTSRTQDLTDWLAGLPQGQRDRLIAARTKLQGWTLETPPAVDGPSTTELDDSIATTLFNVWMHFFLEASLGDELRAIEWDIYDMNQNLTSRIVVSMLREPSTLASGLASTGQSVICDDMETAAVIESCDLIVLRSLDAAMDWIASAEGLDTANMDEWAWGKLHTLTMRPLFPETSLEIPSPTDPDPMLRSGYPKPGDNFVVNRADCGWNDRDFAQDEDGPAQRFLAEVTPGETIRAKMALPGGTIYHRDSPHYRDLMDNYYFKHQHFDIPFTTDEIVTSGEERWVFRSP